MSRVFAVLFLGLAGLAASPLYADSLALSDAIRLTLANNPQMATGQSLRQAAEGRVQQAGTLPNPQVGYLLENFSGSSGRSAGSATSTWSLSQPVITAGKRGARQALASGERDLVATQVSMTRARLIRRVRESYVDVLASEERQAATERQLNLAQQLRDAVSARVTAGKVSPIELARAGVALAAARRVQRQAAQEATLARRQLASLWGAEGVQTSLVDVLMLPTALAAYPEAPDDSPALREARSRVRREQSAVTLAEAQRIPDFTLTAGMKREPVLREDSVLLGVTVPIPLFDRNQGARRAAQADLGAAESSLLDAVQSVQRQRDSLLVQRTASYQEAMQLRDDVLEVASQALEATREGYRAGKFSLIDLLDAQRGLIEAQNAYLAARVSFHKSEAALDELLGREPYPEIAP